MYNVKAYTNKSKFQNFNYGGFIVNLDNKIKVSMPFIHLKNNIVININNEFEKLTGYSKEELSDKSLEYISKILKINKQAFLKNITCCCEVFIFTKESEPLEVTIHKKTLSESEQIYFIKEKPNSRMNDRFQYVGAMLSYSKTGTAILSFPDLILLKANQKMFESIIHPSIHINNSLGLSITEVLPMEYKYNIFEKIIMQVAENKEPYFCKEMRILTYNNEIKYFDISIVPIIISGKIKYIVHTLKDVTEKIVSSNIIKEQNDELEAIIENMDDEVIIFNKDGKCINMNKKARVSHLIKDNTNITIEEIYKYTEFYEMDGSAASFDELTVTKLINGEKNEKKRLIRKIYNNVQYIETTGTPIYDIQNNFICGVLVIRDISEIIKYEESLYIKAQYNSLSNMIENLDLGIYRIKYPELHIIDINKTAYNLIKLVKPNIDPHSSLIGKSINHIITKDYIIDIIHNTSKNKYKSCFKTVKYNLDKKEIFRKYIFQPVLGLNNEVIEVIIIGMDITEEIKVKKELENALKIQDEVYSNVAHELKTPLNVIFSANQVMDLYINNDMTETNKQKLLEYNKSINQNCYRLTKLINNIVDLSKSKLGFLKLNLSNQNIVEVIETIVQSVTQYAKLKNLNIIFDTTIEEKIIACDPMMLERVMLNLLSNAIKFSKPNENIYINVVDKNNMIEISVEDTGIGIDKKHLGLIFDKYYQADKSLTRYAEGSGIGLSLSKVIAEMHGGKISVESELNKGSVFKLELPIKTVKNSKFNGRVNMRNKVEMIEIEFSDIYS